MTIDTARFWELTLGTYARIADAFTR
jgi:hypothetical protein